MQSTTGSEAITLFYFLVAARWIHFSAVFFLFGASLFWFYMSRDRSSVGPGGLPWTFQTTLIMLRIATPVAAISGVAWLAGLLANMTEGFDTIADPETLRLFLFETAFGPLSMVRLALLAAAMAISFLPWNIHRAWLLILMSISALLLVSQAWLGHAAEGGSGFYGVLMIAAYGTHLLAAGAWIGGLLPLILALIEQHDAKGTSQDTLAILSRYSLAGLIAVALIVVSGTANAGFRVGGSYAKLFFTSYGEVLLVKIILVTVMLALAFLNRFVLMPELPQASFNGSTQVNMFRTSVSFELVLGVVVLGAAAVLGITPPPQ